MNRAKDTKLYIQIINNNLYLKQKKGWKKQSIINIEITVPYIVLISEPLLLVL